MRSKRCAVQNQGITLKVNDRNQVVSSSDLSENKGGVGCSVSRAHKTWSQSFLFKDVQKFLRLIFMTRLYRVGAYSSL